MDGQENNVCLFRKRLLICFASEVFFGKINGMFLFRKDYKEIFMAVEGGKQISFKQFLSMVLAIAIPVACQNLLTTTASMVDTIMIGAIDEISLGAVGLCAQFTSLMFSCYWGLLGGGILFFAQYYGAHDEDGINRSYGMMLASMMTVGIVFGVLGAFFPRFVMQIYTDKEVYIGIGVKYLRIVGFAYPLQVYSMAASGLLRATERVKIPLLASIASVCTNLILNWVLIYGHLGMPALGVEGAAIATLCAAIVNVLMVLICSKITKFPYLFAIKGHLSWKKAAAAEFFAKCFPIICNELAMGIANLVINMVLGRQAIEAIAALAVFRTLEGLVIAFFSGFSSASGVLVGNRVGAGEHEEAFVIANRCVYLCGGTILAVCVGLMVLHTPLLHLMGLRGESFAYATMMLGVYCVIATLRMSNWISNDTCRSSGDAITGTCMEIAFMYVLNIPLLCLAGLVWHLPFIVIFIFSYVDEPIRFVLMQIHMHSGGWVRPVTELGRAKLAEFRERHPLRFFWTKMGLKE